MSEGMGSKSNRSLTRFQVTPFQYLLFAIASIAIISLGVSSIIQSNSTIKEARILSDVETPAASIIFTQRETLVYATRLAQWSNGGTTRRNVQIARNILAQRLAVIDTSGRSMGSRAKAPYWKALKESDQIIAEAPAGILPENLHISINQKISPLVDEILAQSRALTVSYQRTVDEEMASSAQRSADRDRLNLIFFYIFIISGGLFLLLNVRTNFKNYRLARLLIDEEQARLDATLAELKRTQLTVAELQNLNEAKNSFIATINHELRTPLTSIIGYIDVIREEREENPSVEIGQYLDVLDRNAQILLHLVESILSLSKLDAASGETKREKVSLSQIIDNAIFIMQPVTNKSNHSITFHHDDQRFVEGDFGQLTQVFINLLGNAIKFSPEGSSIEISLVAIRGRDGRERAQVSVRDHGIGIPSEDVESLFTRFFRARNADSGQFPGTGLGLAIVKQVISLHQGEISVSSKVGEGTTFTVSLPLYLSAEERVIQERRGDVLARAIASLEKATPSSIAAITHDIGGAIGFYGFEIEGEEILEYSRSLAAGEPPLDSFVNSKNHLLSILRSAHAEMSGELNE